MFNLIAIGDPIIDTHVQIDCKVAGCRVHENELCLPYGAKIPIVDSFQDLGGNAPNVAVGTAKLGLTSAVLATIGDDATGRMAVEQLNKRGVDTNLITLDPSAKTRYSIVLNYDAERTILSYSDKKNYQWPDQFPGAHWIYYTGLSDGFEIIQDKLLEHLETNPDSWLVVNPGSYMLKYAPDRLNQIVKRADLLIVNLEEAQVIAGTTLTKAKSYLGLIRKIIELGANEVVLTDGPKGSWAATASEAWHLDAYPVTPVAKTGAGDSFSSAYIAARFLSHDLPHALRWGTANSSSVIQHHGPHAGLLDLDGIQQMVNRFPAITPQPV